VLASSIVLASVTVVSIVAFDRERHWGELFGQQEVYITSFPEGKGKWKVSP
jgi:hypothetical protein